jgi:hypothetical protein
MACSGGGSGRDADNAPVVTERKEFEWTEKFPIQIISRWMGSSRSD